MKIFRSIIQDNNAPSIYDLWLKDGVLYYYDGGWKQLTDKVKLNNPTDGAEIKLGNTIEDKQNNISVCSDLGVTQVVSVDVEGTINNTNYDAVGIYHNGTVSILEGNKVTVFDIDFNSGTVTIDSKYDTSKLLPYVELQIGDSDAVM